MRPPWLTPGKWKAGTRPKHGNKTVEVDGIKFPSRRQASRYAELKLWERAGHIKDLRNEVNFELVPAVILGGRKKTSVRYRADFVYLTNDGHQVVEDAKSPHLRREPYYRLKKHLMKHVHNIEIQEV